MYSVEIKFYYQTQESISTITSRVIQQLNFRNKYELVMSGSKVISGNKVILELLWIIHPIFNYLHYTQSSLLGNLSISIINCFVFSFFIVWDLKSWFGIFLCLKIKMYYCFSLSTYKISSRHITGEVEDFFPQLKE